MKYKSIQTRIFEEDLEFRAVEGENKEMILEGYAALFNVRSNLLYNDFYEVIERGAFDNILKRKELDVIMNFNHDNNQVMARTTNDTLKLNSDDKGLFFRAVLNDTTEAVNLYKRVKRGDIFQNSFAFLPSDDGYREEPDKDSEKRLITITEVEKLRDVSAVTFPAYSETAVQARQEELNEKDSVDLELEERADPVAYKIEGEIMGTVETDDEGKSNLIVESGTVELTLVEVEEPVEEPVEGEPTEEPVEEENKDRSLNEIYKMKTHLLKIKKH